MQKYNNDLLAYYLEELAYLRHEMTAFAQAHPKSAAHLRLTQKGSEDPAVARLFEAFAFLSAELRYKLEDELSEISEPLLNKLAPHFLAPIPVLSIIQFHPNRQMLQRCKSIPKNTLLKMDADQNPPCYFTTIYPVDLWPIEITHAKLTGQPLQAPAFRQSFCSAKEIKASIRFSLGCTKSTLIWSELAPQRLRFYIKADPPNNYHLYDLLIQHTALIAFANSLTDSAPVFLGREHLKALGFTEEENLLPYASQFKLGYRLLFDYAIMPEKFLFIELTNIPSIVFKKLTQPNQTLEIFFYLYQNRSELEKRFNANDIALNCTPIINLFPRTAEPLCLMASKKDYRLIADTNAPGYTQEVYGIQRLIMTNEEHRVIECLPIAISQQNAFMTEAYFYQTKRVPTWLAGHYQDEGTDLLVHFIDHRCQSVQLQGWKVKADIFCTNSDWPNKIAKTTDQIKWSVAEAKQETIVKIGQLKPFSAIRRPFLEPEACWNYLSHLSLNSLSLSSDAAGIAALRGILNIYNFDHQLEYQAQLAALLKINTRHIVARNTRARNGENVFLEGLEIQLEVDANPFAQTSLFLFGSILDQFFALYNNSQSFTQLIINTIQGDHSIWPPNFS